MLSPLLGARWIVSNILKGPCACYRAISRVHPAVPTISKPSSRLNGKTTSVYSGKTSRARLVNFAGLAKAGDRLLNPVRRNLGLRTTSGAASRTAAARTAQSEARLRLCTMIRRMDQAHDIDLCLGRRSIFSPHRAPQHKGSLAPQRRSKERSAGQAHMITSSLAAPRRLRQSRTG